MNEVEAPEVGPIELRTLPRMRVARCFWRGQPGDLGPALMRVEDAARRRGVGPCGVPMAVFPRQGRAELRDGALVVPEVFAELRVPVSDLARPIDIDGVRIEFVRVDRHKAACRMFSGRPGDALRRAQEEIFAWMDRSGLPRAGRRHQHAYLPNVTPGAITVELRVPVAALASTGAAGYVTSP